MKNRINFVYLLVAAAFIIHILVSGGPKGTNLRFEAKGTTAYAYGTTDDYAPGVFRSFIRNHPEVDTLVL